MKMFFVAVISLTLTSLLSATTKATPLDMRISGTLKDDDGNWQVAVVGGEIHFAQNSNDVEMFSLTNGDRKTMQTAPSRMSYPGSVLDDRSNIAYMLGGYDDSGATTNQFHAFHVLRDEWELLAPFPFKIKYSALVVQNDKVYSLGGWSETNGVDVPNAFVYRLNDNHVEDITDNRDVPGDDSDWSEHAALPATVEGACAVRIGSSIFYMGGRKFVNNAAFQYAIELYRSDDGASSWTQLSSMRVGRAAAACVAIGEGSIMITGGLTEGEKTTASTEVYDVSSNTWTTMQPMLHTKNGAPAIVLPGTRDVLVCGGDDIVEYFSLCEVYDWDLNEWRLSNDKMRMGRSHFGMFLVHDDDRRRAQSENSQNLTLSVK